MRKFYSSVGIGSEQGGFTVLLDDRPIKTPDKKLLLLPSETLAEPVAAEWRAQTDNIMPDTMPVTRLVNTAIDRVAPRCAQVVEELVAYGHTDLLCYRADEQEELAALQQECWDPYLVWARDDLGVDLKATAGIIPVRQTDEAIARLRDEISVQNPFALTAFHAFVSGFGSIVLALAVTKKFRNFDECWAASILEQTHQESLWGLDQDVEETRERQHRELLASVDLWHFAHT